MNAQFHTWTNTSFHLIWLRTCATSASVFNRKVPRHHWHSTTPLFNQTVVFSVISFVLVNTESIIDYPFALLVRAQWRWIINHLLLLRDKSKCVSPWKQPSSVHQGVSGSVSVPNPALCFRSSSSFKDTSILKVLLVIFVAECFWTFLPKIVHAESQNVNKLLSLREAGGVVNKLTRLLLSNKQVLH